LIENKHFKKIVFTKETLKVDEYDNCSFIDCDFSNSTVNNIVFFECEFITCNLSLCKTQNTAFKDVKFENCKLLGIDFSECNPFLLVLNFDNCFMNLSSFYKLKLKMRTFKNCSLQEVDFSGSDLSNSKFINCDLKSAVFDRTILVKTNFTSATNYNIDPENNKIKGALFSKDGLIGLLGKYKINIK